MPSSRVVCDAFYVSLLFSCVGNCAWAALQTLHHTDATAAPVTSILHVYKFGPFVPLPEATSTLLDAVLILGKHGLHRVFVVNDGVWTDVMVS